jgi:hypothetical protein
MMQMSGDSRLHWTHGIKKRKTDTLPDGTIRPRENRWSITYRWLRDGECECGNIDLCDTAQRRNGVEKEKRSVKELADIAAAEKAAAENTAAENAVIENTAIQQPTATLA